MVPVVVIALAVALVLAFVVLTIVGQRRRGGSWVLAVLSGCCFPVTWIGWYVEDELPRGASAPAPRP